MRKRGRKLLATGLAGAMTASMLLTGCGSGSASSTTAADTAASGDTAADSAGETSEAGMISRSRSRSIFL